MCAGKKMVIMYVELNHLFMQIIFVLTYLARAIIYVMGSGAHPVILKGRKKACKKARRQDLFASLLTLTV